MPSTTPAIRTAARNSSKRSSAWPTWRPRPASRDGAVTVYTRHSSRKPRRRSWPAPTSSAWISRSPGPATSPRPTAAPAACATPVSSARRASRRRASSIPFPRPTDPAPVSDWRVTVHALPRERTWLLPALHAFQHELRSIPTEALTAVAAHLRVPLSEAYGVATHYPEFRLAEPRARVVRVCTGVSCRIRGGLRLLESLTASAGEDVTLEPFDCAFNCSMAPIVEVNGVAHGRVAVGDLARVLSAPSQPLPLLPPHPALSPSGGEGFGGGSFTEILRRAEELADGRLTLMVGVGSCSLSVGVTDTLRRLNEEITRRGLPARAAPVGCAGLCWAAPTITVVTADGGSRFLPHATADRVPGLLDAVLAERIAPHPEVAEFFAHQRRELTARCGLLLPDDIADAIRRGSYASLAAALEAARPEAVTEAVKAAGLRGRGGAYFAAALKW